MTGNRVRIDPPQVHPTKLVLTTALTAIHFHPRFGVPNRLKMHPHLEPHQRPTQRLEARPPSLNRIRPLPRQQTPCSDAIQMIAADENPYREDLAYV